MLLLNQKESNDFELQELETNVKINNEFSELFPNVDCNVVYVVLCEYKSYNLVSIAPVACKEDFKCCYDHRNIISVERDCIQVYGG